jgi:Bacterial Ig-like domain (group 1)
MSRSLRRIGLIGATFGALVALARCGGSGLTLPGDISAAVISIKDGNNQNGSAGAPLPDSLVVEVLDQRGEPAANQRVSFALEQDLPGAGVTAVSLTDSDGLAKAEWVLGATTGLQAVIASVAGVDTTLRFEAEAGPADAQRIEVGSGNQQEAPVGTELPSPLVVLVTDQFGNPVENVQVDWSAENGSVDPNSSSTGPDGRASTSWVLGSSVGQQSASASSGELSGSPVTFTATAVAGTPSNLVIVSGNGQSGPPGQELPQPLVVRLVDDDGNGVPNRAVTWVIGVGGGSVAPATSTTNGNGEAEARWTLGPASGANTLSAVVSVVGFVRFTATATQGSGGGGGSSPSSLRFLVQPSDAEEDRRMFPPVLIEVLDQNGSRVTDQQIEIKLELIGDNDGRLKGDERERTRSGVATFDDLEVDKEGDYRLRATADGLPAVESNAFEIRERDD